ncbi:TrkA, K+ transport system, NAD-binding component [Halapricum desulfuricans]|uniref:TrkA, K+ transport system, NAD-binding component n=1 Tax=Halapricum desulfuricans TaxID=2841257 RepID=A0A897NPW7_9EURY|nr:hypothetical protein [Halapricum desulfuricans]QSG12879.1 TrkA, K+ transport system, NAD-binding component [Halapricum desulfuricans]
MGDIAVEILLGISFGLLVGVLPAIALGVLHATVAYVADRALPASVVASLALALVAVSGYYADVLALETGMVARNAVVFVVGVLLSVFAASQGERLARTLPRNVGVAVRPERTLSEDAIDAVDGLGQVTVRPAGRVRDLEGHPPLSPTLRTQIADDSWRLPADLPLSALASRLEATLITQYGLEAASVEMDPRGRATIAAAPPSNTISSRLEADHRAVSVRVVAPTELAPGDTVVVHTGDESVDGTVLAVGSDFDDTARERADDGGEIRITVDVPTESAGALLSADRARIVAVSDGTTSAFEAFRALSQAGASVRKVLVGEGTQLDDDSNVLAVETPDGDWRFTPERGTLEPGLTAFVTGTTGGDALRRFGGSRQGGDGS